MAKEMEIVIKPDGTIDIDLINFHGKGCSELAEKMAQELGTKVKTEKKSEYYREEVSQQQKVKRI